MWLRLVHRTKVLGVEVTGERFPLTISASVLFFGGEGIFFS